MYRNSHKQNKCGYIKIPGIPFLFQDGLKSGDHRRNVLIIAVGLVAIVVLIAVAILSFIKGEIRVDIIDFTAAFFSSILVLLFRFCSYKKECCYVAVAMMYCLYAYLFFSTAAEGTTYMWHYTFSFFATLLLYIPTFIYVVCDALTPGQGYYRSSFAIRFIPSVSVGLIFSYLFERERERF